MKAGLRNTEAEEGHSRAGGRKQESSLQTTGLNIHVGADEGLLMSKSLEPSRQRCVVRLI